MYIYIYIYIYIERERYYIYIYIYIHIHTYTYIYIYISCVCVYRAGHSLQFSASSAPQAAVLPEAIHNPKCNILYNPKYVILNIWSSIYIYLSLSLSLDIYIYIYMYTHMCIYAYIHMYTYVIVYLHMNYLHISKPGGEPPTLVRPATLLMFSALLEIIVYVCFIYSYLFFVCYFVVRSWKLLWWLWLHIMIMNVIVVKMCCYTLCLDKILFAVPGPRGGEGTAGWDAIASNRSTGSCLSNNKSTSEHHGCLAGNTRCYD